MPDLKRQSQGLGDHPALVLVDMICGFTDPDCPLGSEATDVVKANQELLAAFRSRKLPVFFTTVIYYNESQASVFRDRVPALNLLEPGSKWVEVDPRLKPLEGEAVVEKQWASGFFKTSMDESLHSLGVDSVVVTGLTTSGCVRATALDGLQYNYKVVIPREAVGDRNHDAHEANLFDLNAKYADVMSLEEVLALVGQLSA